MLSFLILVWEAIIAAVEEAVYKTGIADYTVSQSIIHWIITCVLWGLSALLLIKLSGKFLNFDLTSFREKPSPKGIAVLIILAVLFVLYMSYSWNWVFKPYAEFNTLGLPRFIFQYIYYIFETLVMYLIVSFAQEFGERLFKKRLIPYGGIFLGLTWGIGHFFTQDFATGVLAIVAGAILGLVYVAAKKNPKYAFPIMVLLFMI